MDHRKAPLYDALTIYEENKNISLHVPGHKDGEIFDKKAAAHFHAILKIDATEVNGLDDLHHPTEAIAQAQVLAADAFKAEKTFFLVGGSTAGNLAAALTLCRPGDRILVQRNAHKSVFHGLLLAGASPVYIMPDIEPDTQVATGINPEHLRAALEKYPDVKAVWITSPNYYGMGQNVAALADICHQMNLPLVVDEAHGAHFGQTADVPYSALQAGADLVIQSTHKMLTAMTMGSMLHIQGPRIPLDKLTKVLAMVQSSSPSYPLMASLDVARRHLVLEGRKQLTDTIQNLEKHKKELAGTLKNLSVWQGKGNSFYSYDPLKWIIQSKDASLTGYQLLDKFQEKGCIAEMADTRNVVFVFSIDTKTEWIKRVGTIIREIDEELKEGTEREVTVSSIRDVEWISEEERFVEPVISLQEAFHQDKEQVLLQDAIGRYSAEMVIPYPPGIPLLAPGEEITGAHIETIQRIKQAGGYFQGASDEMMGKMFVLVSL
jgi:arginine decarboxylase